MYLLRQVLNKIVVKLKLKLISDCHSAVSGNSQRRVVMTTGGGDRGGRGLLDDAGTFVAQELQVVGTAIQLRR